jgi:hypothetical protein
MFIDAGHRVNQDMPSDYNGFMYILDGSGMFGENDIKA